MTPAQPAPAPAAARPASEDKREAFTKAALAWLDSTRERDEEIESTDDRAKWLAAMKVSDARYGAMFAAYAALRSAAATPGGEK